MSITIGTEKISSTQKRFLEMARSGSPMAAEAFVRISQDDDIVSGREMLHPDWPTLYSSVRSELRRQVPPSIAERMDTFFDSAQPCDIGVASIDPANVQVAFLLGAGASKPPPSGIPTVKELLPDLLTRAKRLDREEVTKLAEFCDGAGIDNIEDLLTAAQLSEFCSRNPAILRLVDFLLLREEAVEDPVYRRRRRPLVEVSSVAFLKDTLQLLFGLLSSRMLPAQPNEGHKAIASYLRAHPGAPIITTNYDCCMDRALTDAGIPFSYSIDFANKAAAPAASSESTSLVKLHGSLNWFYCETCQEVHWIDIARTVSDYLEDKASYPVIGVCRNCGGQRRGLLVPPLAMKFDVAPPLNPLIDRAGDCFAAANVIVVVGFSFAEADLYISRMVSKAMQASESTNLVVFDPDGAVVDRVRRKFSLRIPSFSASRILRVRGDCAETLPKFLSGSMFQEVPASTEPVMAQAPGR